MARKLAWRQSRLARRARPLHSPSRLHTASDWLPERLPGLIFRFTLYPTIGKLRACGGLTESGNLMSRAQSGGKGYRHLAVNLAKMAATKRKPAHPRAAVRSQLLWRACRVIKRCGRMKASHGGIDMNTEDPKKLVVGFFENLGAGNAAAAFDALSDSATWWILGNIPSLSGTRTKVQFAELLGQLSARIDGPLSLKVKGVTAEGDRVAVEAESF